MRELAARPDVASVAPDAITVVPDRRCPRAEHRARCTQPDLWAPGSTGQGVVVATLDSGVDVSHPDLAGRWRGGTNSWFDPYGQHPTGPGRPDRARHGTMG